MSQRTLLSPEEEARALGDAIRTYEVCAFVLLGIGLVLRYLGGNGSFSHAVLLASGLLGFVAVFATYAQRSGLAFRPPFLGYFRDRIAKIRSKKAEVNEANG